MPTHSPRRRGFRGTPWIMSRIRSHGGRHPELCQHRVTVDAPGGVQAVPRQRGMAHWPDHHLAVRARDKVRYGSPEQTANPALDPLPVQQFDVGQVWLFESHLDQVEPEPVGEDHSNRAPAQRLTW